MKLNYRNQIIITVIFVLLSNTFGTLYGSWEIFSGGFALAGLLWVVHPVVSQDMTETKYSILGIRLIGVVIIAMGLLKAPAINAWVAQFLG